MITRRQARSALRHAGPFRVRVHGPAMLVEPAWPSERPAICLGRRVVRDQRGDCTRCGMPHIGGVATRLVLAQAIEATLRRADETIEWSATSLANGTIHLRVVFAHPARRPGDRRLARQAALLLNREWKA